MPRHFVSVRVTKHGKFRKTHIAQINAPDEAEALRHLENRCKPGGEYSRKFPGATFAEFQVTPLYGKPVEPRERVVNRDLSDVTPIREAREQLLERLGPTGRGRVLASGAMMGDLEGCA